MDECTTAFFYANVSCTMQLLVGRILGYKEENIYHHIKVTQMQGR